MAEKTGISWTDSTWSPLLGCSPASAGCARCYALRDIWRMAHNPNPKISAPRQGLVEKSGGRLRWTGKVALLPQQLEVPLHWRKERRIFVANQSDLFHPEVPFQFISSVFYTMSRCPQHRFQVLTKRPERMREFFATASARIWASADEPLPNVWLGVSVENQASADERIPHLLATPAAVRFLSCEPLLGPVSLTPTIEAWAAKVARGGPIEPRLHWVIAGGESGQLARPCEEGWIRSIVEQCRGAGVPCWVKQLGTVWAHTPQSDDEYFLGTGDTKGADMERWPVDLRVQQMPEVAT